MILKRKQDDECRAAATTRPAALQEVNSLHYCEILVIRLGSVIDMSQHLELDFRSTRKRRREITSRRG